MAVSRCADTGVVLITLGNTHHLGRIGAYGEMVTAAGLASIHFVNVTDHTPLVAAFGGADARFGPNPICIALPATDDNAAFVLDFATSMVAYGKVREAWCLILVHSSRKTSGFGKPMP